MPPPHRWGSPVGRASPTQVYVVGLVPLGAASAYIRRHSHPNTNTIMAKTQNSKKETKKQPLKTPAEKKAAKREKKGR